MNPQNIWHLCNRSQIHRAHPDFGDDLVGHDARFAWLFQGVTTDGLQRLFRSWIVDHSDLHVNGRSRGPRQ